jgi:hypothetical protein
MQIRVIYAVHLSYLKFLIDHQYYYQLNFPSCQNSFPL